MVCETQHKRVGDEPPLFAALRTKRFAMPTLSWVQRSWCQGQQLTGAEPAGSSVILRSCYILCIICWNWAATYAVPQGIIVNMCYLNARLQELVQGVY